MTGFAQIKSEPPLFSASALPRRIVTLTVDGSERTTIVASRWRMIARAVFRSPASA
jgi:hypothetical protein